MEKKKNPQMRYYHPILRGRDIRLFLNNKCGIEHCQDQMSKCGMDKQQHSQSLTSDKVVCFKHADNKGPVVRVWQS